MKRTDKRGVDLVVEHVGGDFLEKSIRCLTRGGRVVTVGGTQSYDCKVPVNYIFHKELQIIGSNSATKHDLEVMMPLLGNGKLKTVIDRVFPLQQAAEAHRYLEQAKAIRQGGPACRSLISAPRDASDIAAIMQVIAAHRAALIFCRSRKRRRSCAHTAYPCRPGAASSTMPQKRAGRSRRARPPVVVKAVAPELTHKTDVGAVIFPVDTPAAAEAACRTIAARVAAHRPDIKLAGFLIEAYRPAQPEWILSLRNDPHFGPAIMFGLGGSSSKRCGRFPFGLRRCATRILQRS